jgi:benzil reductase ((S)-benzoin forming)
VLGYLIIIFNKLITTYIWEDSLVDDHRLAFVTGSSSGLGAAISDGLLRNGWSVVGMSRRKVVKDNPQYTHFRVDLAQPQELEEITRIHLAALLKEREWSRMGLVNNAGAVAAMLPLEEIELAQLVRSFTVNAIAPIYLMGFIVRETASTTALRIVNISTGAAVQAVPGLTDYGSGKAALLHASRTLAAELASTKRHGGPFIDASIMSFSPGVVDTPMQVTARSADHPWFQMFRDLHAQGLLRPPQGPARDVIEFLESDGNAMFVERRFANT